MGPLTKADLRHVVELALAGVDEWGATDGERRALLAVAQAAGVGRRHKVRMTCDEDYADRYHRRQATRFEAAQRRAEREAAARTPMTADELLESVRRGGLPARDESPLHGFLPAEWAAWDAIPEADRKAAEEAHFNSPMAAWCRATAGAGRRWADGASPSRVRRFTDRLAEAMEGGDAHPPHTGPQGDAQVDA